jgi:hypothetical protein
MSIESTSEFTQALIARVAKYESLKSKLGRKPTDAEMGTMPTPGEVDIILGELEHSRKVEALHKVRKPKKYTPPAPEVLAQVVIARSRTKAMGIKAKRNGLIGVHQNPMGSWSARFTPPLGPGCTPHTAVRPTMEEAIEVRNSFVRRYYGDTRPWLLAEYTPSVKRKRKA